MQKAWTISSHAKELKLLLRSNNNLVSVHQGTEARVSVAVSILSRLEINAGMMVKDWRTSRHLSIVYLLFFNIESFFKLFHLRMFSSFNAMTIKNIKKRNRVHKYVQTCVCANAQISWNSVKFTFHIFVVHSRDCFILHSVLLLLTYHVYKSS